MEPIAIIGIGCRFPGDSAGTDDIDTPGALWDFLLRKGDAYTDFPRDRINIDAWHHPKQGHPGSFYTRGGCFLKQDSRLFDPSMFGISPQEARTLDPAHRKLLETVYEAFESSGTPLSKVNGSSTGCFVGSFNYDHQVMQCRDPDFPEPYGMTGGSITLLSNRISYTFDLRGPSMTVDTACSSSMYALHLACSAIESGECTAAVVGGSNLILTPECQIFSSALGSVSKTSKCHTFDAAADGYARAEGVGVLYIKKLSQAINDGDPIRAVIRATSANANGRTGGITHPDPSGQERAIRRAYQRAGDIDPAMTSYFECHGTGTPVGDPLEVEAIGRVFAADRTPQRPLYLGSIKSNMGHCEAASGIAGIIKAVLAIENKIIPPIRALDRVNPNVDLQQGRLHIVQENMLWPECVVRRASVNSFGFGGANAHTILEETDNLAFGRSGLVTRYPSLSRDYEDSSLNSSAESTAPMTPMSTLSADSFWVSPAPSEEQVEAAIARSKLASQRYFLLPISAHNEQTLRRNIDALMPRIDHWRISDLAFTLGCRRSAFTSRSFVVANREQVQKAALKPENFISHRALSSQNRSIGFIFTGQGAQWPEMGKELMDTFHVYLDSIRYLDKILTQLVDRPGWSLEGELQAPAEISRVYEASLSQPLATAVQIALVDLLASWNILPAASLGHSSGEIAAAYAAGHISAAQAIIIAYARGRAVARNNHDGAMLAVSITTDAVEPLLLEFSRVSVACYNSPESLTLSGDWGQIHAIKAALDSRGIFNRILHTGGNAYHSEHMKAIGPDYESELCHMFNSLDESQYRRVRPCSTFVSSVSNSVNTENITDPAYWRLNLESPVLFSQSMTKMMTSCSVDCLVEVGPHAALCGPIRQVIRSMDVVKTSEYLPTVLRGEDCAKSLLESTGVLWSKGFDVNLEAINNAYRTGERHNSRVIVDLPKYQWQYGDINYAENRWTKEWRLKTHPHHDLLGSRQPGGNRNEPMWRNILKSTHVPWLKDHRIGSDIIFPAAGYIAMATEAALQMVELQGTDRSETRCCIVKHLSFDLALTVPESDSGVEVLLNLHRTRLSHQSYHDNSFDFTVTSVVEVDGDHVFAEHAHGNIAVSMNVCHPRTSSKSVSDRRPIMESRWYDTFSKVGLKYGSSFQGLSNIQASKTGKESTGTHTAEQHTVGESAYIVHPTAIDAAIQLAIIAAHGGCSTSCTAAFIPRSLAELTISTGTISSGMIGSWATSSFSDAGNIHASITMFNGKAQPFVSFDGLELIRAKDIVPPTPSLEAHPFSKMMWRPDINSLTTEQCRTLFDPIERMTNGVGSASLMDSLALNLMLELHGRHPDLFIHPPEDLSLQRFFLWMKSMIHQVNVVESTQPERAGIISRLLHDLSSAHGPESRLLYHMFDSYPKVFAGKMSGLQAAVQNNLLSDMYEHMQLYRGGSQSLGEILELISHDKPDLDIFEIGGGTGSAAREILMRLRGDSEFRGYNTYTFTDITPSFLATAQESFQQYSGVQYAAFDMEKAIGEQKIDKTYDVVVASNVIHVTADMQKTLINVRRLIKPGGKLALFELIRPTMAWIALLGSFPGFWKGDHDPGCPRTEGPFLTLEMWKDILPRCGFSGVDIVLDHFAEQQDAAIMLATAIDDTPSPRIMNPKFHCITVVYRDIPSAFCIDFKFFAEASGLRVELTPLTTTRDFSNCHVVCLAETDRSLFLNCTEIEWAGVKKVLLGSASTVWVTGGDLIHGSRPEFAMINGVISAVHAEDGASKSVTLDLDLDEPNMMNHFTNILLVNKKAIGYRPGEDFQYRSKLGVIHTSRLVDDEILNQATELEFDQAEHPEDVSRMSVRGALEAEKDFATLAEDEIEVIVKAYKKIGEAAGLPSTDDCLNVGFTGIVKSVGASIARFEPGDEVSGLCSRILNNNITRTRAQFCLPFVEDRSSEGVACSIVATCIALYGLEDAAQIRSQETVLVYTSDFNVQMMACLLAGDIGASVFTFVPSEEEKKNLLKLVPSLSPQRVLIEEGQDLRIEMMQLTGDEGVDVILSDSNENHCHLLAPFGRYVGFSTGSPIQTHHLPTLDPSKCMTYTSFSLGQMGKLRPARIQSLLDKYEQYRMMEPLPTETMSQEPVAEQDDTGIDISSSTINIVARTSNAPTNLSKDAKLRFIQHDGDSTQVNQKLSFGPKDSFLLVGCLGGLGESFSNWLVSRGARNLIYLSRSGASSARAAELVARMQRNGVQVQVVQGDVSNPEDVRAAVAKTNGYLKGVVQAPLVLKDSLLHSMTLADFNATALPRVVGTLNLHHATKDRDLDFFMMWSSWTEVLGSASQANYMASCAFMDAFALHRRNVLGLPATSLSLGHMLDVGVVAGNLDYQEHLLRMGLYGNDEREFLRFCEAAISPAVAAADDGNDVGRSGGQGHLLAGLEPSGLAANRFRYPLESMHWYQDKRFSHLLKATERFIEEEHSAAAAASSSNSGHDSKITISDDDPSQPLITRIQKRVARCLYLAAEDVDVNVPITAYGIDSMVAAQIRNWLLSALGASVSLFLLLHPTLTVVKLTAEVEKCMAVEDGD